MTFFPAARLAKGHEIIIEHGDTLYMTAGFWHHTEYTNCWFAMSLRDLQNDSRGKLNGA
ncbi:MAG: hypothetical protein ABI707_17145 [Ferruginibacter sp.]